MQSSKLCFLSAVIVFLVLFSTLMFSVSAADNQEVAASSISKAEKWMAKAYEAVLDAESFDSDVSGLLVRLNDAAKLLSDAHMSFDIGDFDGASGYADSTSEMCYEIVDEAEFLEIEAANARVYSSWVFLAISVVAVSVVVVASVVGYKFFKRYYYDRLDKMRPEVESS